MSLAKLLPPPIQRMWDKDSEDKKNKLVRRNKTENPPPIIATYTAPPYGHRRGWMPRSSDDFGDGGSFPEIAVVQYPSNMGRPDHKSTSNALPVQLDAEGNVKYDVIARQGHSKDKIVYSKLTDMLSSEITKEDDPSVQKPDETELLEHMEKTREILEKLTTSKISAAMPVKSAPKAGPAQFIRYTPSQQGSAFNSGAKQRVIRMVEIQKDPIDPPKFKINKKIPKGPPSPPPPVMHSPTRKVTVKEQKEWKIPPCISNWKNAKGYTIPLDKRLAADGRGLQQVHINENFAKLAESLYIADRKAREAVEMRAQLEKKLAQKEKEKKEENLRALAQKAREERAGIRPINSFTSVTAKDDEAKERDLLRMERHKDRARERNLARAAPDKRSKALKDRERDISEQIALGLPAKTMIGGEGQFDQRLFNSTKGMDSGYGDDEAYNVYDKPWRDTSNLAQHIYRPSKNIDKDVYGDDLETLVKTNRFVPDKEFGGTDRSVQRTGPVQFEKQPEEEDPFGLDQFLTQAKHASKRSAHDKGKDEKRRRKE